jgi:hypothetical protein
MLRELRQIKATTEAGILNLVPENEGQVRNREQAIGEARAYGFLEKLLNSRIEDLEHQIRLTESNTTDESPDYPEDPVDRSL